MKAQEAFHRLGPNFLTPKVLSYKTTDKHFVELSYGYVLGVDVFGVTVRDTDNYKEDKEELSKSFPTEAEARKYFRSIE